MLLGPSVLSNLGRLAWPGAETDESSHDPLTLRLGAGRGLATDIVDSAGVSCPVAGSGAVDESAGDRSGEATVMMLESLVPGC